jgi:hypothetical protein
LVLAEMSAETSGRVGIRGAVSGYVVHAKPEHPALSALRQMREECSSRIARLAELAKTRPAAEGQAEQVVMPVIAAPFPTGEAETEIASAAKSPAKPVSPPLRFLLAARGRIDAARLAGMPIFRKAASVSVRVVARFDALLAAVLRPAITFLGKLPAPPRKAATGIAAIGVILAALIAFVPLASEEPLPEPIRTVLPNQPVWRELVKPLPVFNLEGGGLSGNRRSYAAYVRSDGAREDIMSWAPPALPAAAPAAVVIVHRQPPGEVTEQRLFSEIARRAAAFGQSLDSAGTPNAIATKFGDLEVMDIRLTGPGGEQACLAFRHIAWSAPLAFTGWRCGTAAKPIDRPSLVCFVDRLDVLSAGEEAWLRDYFADSERFRSFCASKRVVAGNVGKPAAVAPDLRPEVTGSLQGKDKKKSVKRPAKRKKKRGT